MSDVINSAVKGLIAGTVGGYLYGIAESSGEVIWELLVEGQVSSVTAVDGSSILVATEDGGYSEASMNQVPCELTSPRARTLLWVCTRLIDGWRPI